MYKRKFHSRKQFIKFLISNGVHIWVILFLANVVLLYSYNLASRAASNKSDVKTTQIASDEITPEPTSSDPTEIPPTPTPVGPILNVVFTIPPIGSSGANMKPLRTERDVVVALYPPDLNAFDAKVKPLYASTAKAIYDDNQLSPTYTSYIVTNADLGEKIKSGRYQITIRTDQTLPQLLKEKPKNIAGSVYNLDKSLAIEPAIPPQSLIIGDIAPVQGNGIMDINDYNTFVSCFSQTSPTNLCPNKAVADLDDNGTVDGVDYNFLVKSFKQLLDLGYPVPSIIISPTPRQVSKLSELDTTKAPKKATAAAAPTKPSGGNPIILIFSLLFLVLCGGGAAFFVFKNKNLLAKFHKKIEQTPSETPEQPAEGAEAGTDEAAQQAPTEGEATPEETQTPQTSEEQPTEVTEQPAADAPIAADSEAPAAPAEVTAPKPGDAIEGDYYVKKQADTDDKSGVWVTITGDNGPELALYKGSNLHEGFSHVKGVYQEVNKKTYIELSEINPSDSD